MLLAPRNFQQELRPYHRRTVKLTHEARVTVQTGWLQCKRLTQPSTHTQFTKRDSMTSFLEMLLKFYRGTANCLAYVDAFKHFAMEAEFQPQKLDACFKSTVEKAPWPESDVMGEVIDVTQEHLREATDGRDIVFFYLTRLRELMPLLGFLGAQALHESECGLDESEFKKLKLLQTLAVSFLQTLVEYAVKQGWLRSSKDVENTALASEETYLSVLNEDIPEETSKKFFAQNTWLLEWLKKADFGEFHQRVQDNTSVIKGPMAEQLGVDNTIVPLARQLSLAGKRKVPWKWQTSEEQQGKSVVRLFMQGTLAERGKRGGLSTYQLVKPSSKNVLTLVAIEDERKASFFSAGMKKGLRRAGMVLLVGAAFAVPYVFFGSLLIAGVAAAGMLLVNVIVDRVIACRENNLRAKVHTENQVVQAQERRNHVRRGSAATTVVNNIKTTTSDIPRPQSCGPSASPRASHARSPQQSPPQKSMGAGANLASRTPTSFAHAVGKDVAGGVDHKASPPTPPLVSFVTRVVPYSASFHSPGMVPEASTSGAVVLQSAPDGREHPHAARRPSALRRLVPT